MEGLDKATYLPILFEFIFYERLSSNLYGSNVLLFSEFINVVSILYYISTEFIILFYAFLVKSFVLGVFSAFTSASTIANL